MHEPNLDPALNNLAAGLRDLTPAGGINRDRVLFEAGRRSVRSRAWPLATGAFAALAAVLGVRLTTLPEPAPQVVFVQVPAPAVEPSSPESPPAVQRAARNNIFVDWLFASSPVVSPSDPWRQRELWLRGGPTGPLATASPSPPPPVERWLGLPSILFSDTLKLHPGIGSLRGEV